VGKENSVAKKARTPEVTHKIMSSIHSKNTRPELTLRKELWRQKIRYRVNYKKLPGKPDIALTKYKIAVFCDGDFWHGHNWAIRGLGSLDEELAMYSDFWKKKILRNIERDEEDNKAIKALGWTVVRIWESDIKTDLPGCIQKIRLAISRVINEIE
jgi:DNA mismatch endonuclease (patch repair protein)